jgi:hypothetical protein
VGRRAEVARPSRSARARRLPKSFAFGLGTQSQVAPLNSLQRGGRSPRRLCTRRDLNPHTLRYRNLNPVGVYRDAVRCSEPAGSRSSWLPLAASRYASWTIKRRIPRLLTTAAGGCRCSGTAGRHVQNNSFLLVNVRRNLVVVQHPKCFQGGVPDALVAVENTWF